MMHDRRRISFISPLVALVLLLSSACGGSDGPSEAAPSPSPTPQAEAAQCEPIETFEDQGNEHIEEGTPVKSYNSTPPTSGPHWSIPADPGFYDEELPPEQLVHNLEHGQIVVYYRPDLPDDALAAIEDLVAEEPVALLAVPYEDIEDSNTLVLTAWTASMSCTGLADQDVTAFRSRYQGRGPEPVGIPKYKDR